MKLKNKCAIITGASQGLGFEIAKIFLKEGANILICSRSEKQLEEAKSKLSRHISFDGQILLCRPVDITKFDQVDQFVQFAFEKFPALDILVNNAGIYGPKGCLEEIVWKEWTNAVNINLFGTVYFCRAVLPHFKKKRGSKIINLSGGGATNPMPRFSAYAAAKAGVVRFTETLAEEVKEFGIDVNAIAPGPLNTRFVDEVLEAGPEKVGRDFYERAKKQKAEGGAPLEKAASLCVYLASAQSNGITGKLISAVWDPWQKFEDRQKDLSGTDIYTLRRIVPKDRQMSWG